MDDNTQVSDLKDSVARFIALRDWEQYHTPAHISAAIAVEAGELQECFLWNNEFGNPMDVNRIRLELADVLIYCISMSNAMGIDISDAINHKMAMNEKRFPQEGWMPL